MLQCLEDENILQFYRHHNKVEMLTKDTFWKHYLKTSTFPKGISAEYIPFALAVIGDDADFYKGVHGIGGKTFAKMMIYLEDLLGPMTEVYDNIDAGKTIFKPGIDKSLPKMNSILKNEKLIVRNIRLASYEMLSRYVNADFPTDRIKMRNFIKDSSSFENKIKNGRVLHAALHKAGLMQVVNEATVYNIFQE
jgi:5'-3' exonuclease